MRRDTVRISLISDHTWTIEESPLDSNTFALFVQRDPPHGNIAIVTSSRSVKTSDKWAAMHQVVLQNAERTQAFIEHFYGVTAALKQMYDPISRAMEAALMQALLDALVKQAQYGLVYGLRTSADTEAPILLERNTNEPE